jgi:C-terminal processing protease CtpA/Prc
VPDLDWDKTYREYIPKVLVTESTAEYYGVLQRFCALLKDGHTNVYPPSNIRKDRDQPQVAVRNAQHQAVVVNVSTSLEKTVPIGSEIISVGDMPTEEYLKTHIFPLISSSTDHILWDWGIKDMLAGTPDSQIQVSILTPEGAIKSVTLFRNEKTAGTAWIRDEKDQGPVEFKLMENGIGYLALNGFGERTVQRFKEVLPKLYTCEGIILDLRGNTGGSDGAAYEILCHFTDKPFLGPKWKTPEHRAAFKAWDRGSSWYEGESQRIVPPMGRKITAPMVVLTGHETASAAENFLVSVDSIKRAIVVGQRTFGSTGQPLDFNLPGRGTARICTKRNTYPDGRDIVGIGIIPDIEVNPTKESIISGRDIVLEKGLKVLKEQL